MNTILTLLLVLFLATVLWELVLAIAGDGRGHRPPPRSHVDEPDVGSPRWWVDAWQHGAR